jgi:hypothetical protein
VIADVLDGGMYSRYPEEVFVGMEGVVISNNDAGTLKMSLIRLEGFTCDIVFHNAELMGLLEESEPEEEPLFEGEFWFRPWKDSVYTLGYLEQGEGYGEETDYLGKPIRVSVKEIRD